MKSIIPTRYINTVTQLSKDNKFRMGVLAVIALFIISYNGCNINFRFGNAQTSIGFGQHKLDSNIQAATMLDIEPKVSWWEQAKDGPELARQSVRDSIAKSVESSSVNLKKDPTVQLDMSESSAKSWRKMSTEEKLAQEAWYIEKYKKIAIEEMHIYGIPASITLAQGLVETGAGTSDLSRYENNHFGIKCKKQCIGCRCVNYKDDSKYDMFRVFPSAWYSFREHSKLLSTAPRYAGLFKCKDAECWARGLQEAGYATSQTYTKSLLVFIRRHNLTQYDRL